MTLRVPGGSWIFALMALAAFSLPAYFVVTSFMSYRAAAEAMTRVTELGGRIRYLDEVLTMSARMAATTGEPQWVERYDSHVDDLTLAIDDLLALSSLPEVTERVRATESANTALIEMEMRAFELARRGARRQAYAVLMSPEYRGQKFLYAQGMDGANAAAQQAFAAQTQERWNDVLTKSAFAVAGALICLLGWLFSSGHSRRERELLLHALRDERDAATSASTAKSIFLANMSHELRTPLNAIIGYSEMLREGAQEEQRQHDVADIDRVLGASRSLLTLVNDLLDLSKAESGKFEISPQQFDVRSVVEGAVATIAPSASARGNQIKVDIAADVGAISSDDFRVSQCLLNLLSNAAKFTRDGKISVRARRLRDRSGEWLEVGVTDTGVGIPAERLPHLFEPFVQGDAAAARAYEGTGLGLAITRTLARLLGGDVSVESQEGRGSTFTLTIRADLGEAQALAA
jgi:signal transduction histidine kinase